MKFAAAATVAFAASANAFAPATTGNVSYEVVLCSGNNCRCLMEAYPKSQKNGIGIECMKWKIHEYHDESNNSAETKHNN